MHQLAALPRVDLPADDGFLQWLDEEGLTQDVTKVVGNLRRYFKDEEIRVERNLDPDGAEDVMVIVDTGPDESDRAYEILTKFDEEWLLQQPTDLIFKVSVHLE